MTLEVKQRLLDEIRDDDDGGGAHVPRGAEASSQDRPSKSDFKHLLSSIQ